jgi:hypothetical protein
MSSLGSDIGHYVISRKLNIHWDSKRPYCGHRWTQKTFPQSGAYLRIMYLTVVSKSRIVVQARIAIQHSLCIIPNTANISFVSRIEYGNMPNSDRSDNGCGPTNMEPEQHVQFQCYVNHDMTPRPAVGKLEQAKCYDCWLYCQHAVAPWCIIIQ